MPHSFGYRATTRDVFKKGFRKNGLIKLSKYTETYKLGQIVDVVGDGAVQKGMPHKFYHGKTGRVWNVTKRALGVEINKRVGNRILKKRIHVRVEHVQKSTSRQGFLDRVAKNEQIKNTAKETKVQQPTKRIPAQPRTSCFVKGAGVETMYPVVYGGIST